MRTRSAMRVLQVDPTRRRQLEPHGLALVRDGDGGMLVISDVCSVPDCDSREVQLWLLEAPADLVRAELDQRGRLEVFWRPQTDARRRRPPKRSPHAYASFDVDDGTVSVHPSYQSDPEGLPLIDRLEAEMDGEFRSYLRRRFEEGRRTLDRGRSRASAKPRRRPDRQLH